MTANPQPAVHAGHLVPRADWLDLRHEDILEPTLPIIDPHHHLWDRQGLGRYLFDELLADARSGHNVLATVHAQCRQMHRAGGPEEFRPVGETEFVNGVAAQSATGLYGSTRLCAAIIGYVDMMLGERAEPVLEAHLRVGGGRFRGIRYTTAWDADREVRSTQSPEPGRLLDARFRRAFALFAKMSLSYDVWALHPQLPEVADLAGAFPETTIILDHCGGPIGIGPYAGKKDETFRSWSESIRTIARHPNVVCKLGGLTMRLGGLEFYKNALPPSSVELADAFKPWVDTCIEAFGPARCMFQSNFPVDKSMCSYPILWNAFKHLAAGYSAEEKADLFSRTASRIYQPVLT